MTRAGLAAAALLFAFAPFALAADTSGRAGFDERNFGRFPKTLNESLVSMNEQLIGKDPRYEPLRVYAPDSRLRQASRPVGLLDILNARGSGTCTASLIAEDLLLTNAHCAEEGVRAYRFFAEYFDEGDTGLKGYEVEVKPVEVDRGLDYAILRVKGTPGRTYGVLTLSTVKPAPGDDLSIFHHPLGQPKSVTRFGCRARQVRDDGELLHLCDTMPGSSGSPVLTGDSRLMLALHHAGAKGGASPVNLAITVGALAQKSPIIARLAKAAPPVVTTVRDVDLSPAPGASTTAATTAAPTTAPSPTPSPAAKGTASVASAAKSAGSATAERAFTLRNQCDQPVRVAARYKDPASGKWTTLPWQTLEPGTATAPKANRNRFVYYVADSKDRASFWEASAEDTDQNVQSIDGLWYRMKMVDVSEGSTVNLTCGARNRTERLVVVNRCNRKLDVALRVKGADGQWATHGFYELDVGERISRPTANGVGYVYAEGHDPALREKENLYWRGGDKSNEQVVGRRKVSMMHTSWNTDVHVAPLTCTRKSS